MGTVTLYTEPYASYYYFRDDVVNQPSGSYIYLLPLNRAVRYLKRDLIKNSAQDALFDPLIFTFSSLIKSLNQKMPNGKKIITEAMKHVLLQDLLKQKTHELESIHPAKSTKGVSNLIRRLNQMLTELTHFGYQAESFVEPPPGAEAKYHDFAVLMHRIQDSFQDELIDETGIFAETVTAIDELWINQIFPDLECIYISGYGIYTPLMLRFITQLQSWVDIKIVLVYSDKNPDLFRHTRNAFDAIQKIADHIKINHPQVNGLECFLFNQQITTPQSIKENHKYHIQKTRSIREELSFIAFKIKEMHHKEAIPLHRIGVTFPNLETYAPLLRVVFSEYNIPFNLSTGFSLAQSPLIQIFLNCLKIVHDNYSVKIVLDLLSSAFVKNDYPAETARLARILQKNRQLYFTEDWSDQLAELTQDKKMLNSDQSDTDYNGLIKLITHIKQTMKQLGRNKLPVEFQTDFLSCLKNLGLLDWYEHADAPLSRIEKEREFRAFNQFIKLLNQMIWILQYKNPGHKYSLHEYETYLREIVQNAVYNVREWPEYGVQVMPRLEIQSVDLGVLFIGGLVEGVFPRKFVKDIFFNDSERELMGLYASEDLRDQDKFLFYQLLTTSSGPVFLTFPSITNETKQIRSSFLDDLFNTCSVVVREDAPAEQLINEKNILIHAAKNIFGETQNDLTSLLSCAPTVNRKFWVDTLTDLYRIFDRSAISEFEGYLTKSQNVLIHLQNTIPGKTFSVTALESYLFCPMQYFLQRIVNLEPAEEVEELLTAKEKGILIHRILFRFLSELRSKNKNEEPWKNGELLTNIAREEFETLPFKGFLWDLEQENYFGAESQSGLWYNFLQNEEVEIGEKGFIPTYFEMAFGLTREKSEQDALSMRNPLILKQKKLKIRLSGKIDRIDIDESGQFFVIDYKTGSGAVGMSRNEIESGKSLQLPIYLEAVRRRFREKRIDAAPAGGSYYFLGDTEKPRRKIVLDKTNYDRVLERVIETVFEIVGDLENGRFLHTEDPDDHRCSRYCSFARICRKDRSKLLARKNMI